MKKKLIAFGISLAAVMTVVNNAHAFSGYSCSYNSWGGTSCYGTGSNWGNNYSISPNSWGGYSIYNNNWR